MWKTKQDDKNARCVTHGRYITQGFCFVFFKKKKKKRKNSCYYLQTVCRPPPRWDSDWWLKSDGTRTCKRDVKEQTFPNPLQGSQSGCRRWRHLFKKNTHQTSKISQFTVTLSLSVSLWISDAFMKSLVAAQRSQNRNPPEHKKNLSTWAK